jgi:hypothetical protein
MTHVSVNESLAGLADLLTALRRPQELHASLFLLPSALVCSAGKLANAFLVRN